MPARVREHGGILVKENQWGFTLNQRPQRCLKVQKESGGMENLAWGCLSLGLLALAVAGFLVWWTSRMRSRRDFAQPMKEAGLS